jgi:hypothetical protein
MSCPHGNHPDACDICDEVAAAYNSGVEHTKREWVGLTEWHIAKVLQQCQDEMTRPPSEDFAFKFARAIEAKLKEKNT